MPDYCKDNNTKKKKRIPDNVPNTVYTQIIEYENTSILRIVVLNTQNKITIETMIPNSKNGNIV